MNKGGSGLILFSCFVFLFSISIVDARPRTDSVVLINGDTVTGEILSMSRAMLSLHTDSMSVVQIKWQDVVQIRSDYQFVVEDTFGIRSYGTLSSSGGKVEVTGNNRTERINFISVVTIYPLRRRWWKRLDGSIGLSYSYTKSSSTTQFSWASDIRYKGSDWLAYSNIQSILSFAGGETTADRTAASLGGARYFGNRWYWIGVSGYIHNAELDLEHRYSLLGGIGRRLRQTNRTLIGLFGGISYARELYTNEPNNNSAEAVIGSNIQFFKLYSPRVDIVFQVEVIPSLTEHGRVRSELSTQSKIELIRDFYWTLSFYESYDSKPPDVTTVNNDYGVVTGISWTFGR
jgi:Protein of unknown function, DUF481